MKKFKHLLFVFSVIISATILSACSFFKTGGFTEQINDITLYKMSANVKIANTRTGYFPSGIKSDEKIGSGAIIAKDNDDYYYFLTNYHVVDIGEYSRQTLKITDYKGNTYQVESSGILLRDIDKDLALVKFYSSINLTLLKIEDDDLSVGDAVFSVGSPSGQINAVTVGGLLGKPEAPVVDGQSRLKDKDGNVLSVYCHDAPIIGGSSGGMLLDENLNLVGINYAGAIGNDDEFVFGYSVPSKIVLEFLSKSSISEIVEIV